MECKKCGAKLQLEHKFCPYCGEVNQAVAQHVAQMEHYKKDYDKTQRRVLKNSTWFSRHFGLMLALVLVLVLNGVFIFMANAGISYDFADNKIKEQGKTPEVQAYLEELMEAGEYSKVTILRNEKDWNLGEEEYKWTYFYICCNEMRDIKSATLYRRGMAVSSYSASTSQTSLENISQSIKYFYQHVQNCDDEEVAEKVAKMRAELEIFMQAYLYLTPEDISGLTGMDEVEICTLLQERERDHEDSR